MDERKKAEELFKNAGPPLLKMKDPLYIKKNDKPKPKIIHFPLSLANCGTLDGNIAVLEEFRRSLELSTAHDSSDKLCFDSKNVNYDLKESRLRNSFVNRITNVLAHVEVTVDAEEDLDSDFIAKYNELRQRLFNSSKIEQIVSDVNVYFKDNNGRSFLHLAVESNHKDIVDVLFSIGFNPNCTENIGVTPLGIAVIKGYVDIAKLLLDNGAECKFSCPSAYQIALDIGQNDILAIFDDYIARDLNCSVMLMKQCNVPVNTNVTNVNDVKMNDVFSFSRTNVKVPVFGDNGVEKLVRSIKTRSGKYNIFCECPGDLHASGYADECMAKCLGNSGMYFCLGTVLKRKNNAETFGTSKFQEGNLSSNAEACRDTSFGYGLALFQEFRLSSLYPVNNVNESTIMTCFKLFIVELATNPKCKHYLQAVTLFGPWHELYKVSVRNGFGLGREVAWLIGLLVYGPMQKKNYFASAFVHCVNFCYDWPLLIRELVQNHFSIAVKGKVGHNLAMDEYVETYLVKPLKMYTTGHTSVRVLKMLSASSQLVKQVRESYVDAFKGPASNKHKMPSSVIDQIKVCLFVLENGFYDMSTDQVNVFNAEGRTEKLSPKSVLDVVSKGKALLQEKFPSKMYTYYSGWRSKQVKSSISACSD